MNRLNYTKTSDADFGEVCNVVAVVHQWAAENGGSQ